MKSRHLLALIMSLLILAASSCSKPEIDSATTQGKDNVSASQSKTQDGELSFKQLDPPQKGEEIAQLTTNYGVIKMRLFPEDAPLAVENFKTLIGQGYYDGLTFHRVIDNFMIQGGDPTGTGAGGESCWGEDFAIELSKELFHFRGALSMANTGRPNSNSCQFFIVQNPTADKSQFDMMEQYGYPVDNIPDSVKEKYAQVGGTPNLDANYYPEDLGMVGYTVFGQVFDGMDVVDAIAAVETDSGDKPVSDVVIEKAEIVTYNG